MSSIERVLQEAADEVGVHEVGGNNRGKRVEEYLASVDLAAGNPWCAAFIAWCMREAGIPLNQDGWPKTGFCPTIETWARTHKVLHTTPKRGDVFLLCDAQGPFHTGFVSAVNSDGTVSTIEGNTNDGGSADGDGVFRRVRRISACEFVRWDDAIHVDRKVKIFKNANGATVIVDGVSYSLKSLRVNGEAVATTEIIAEY